jgi:hypothetical protein
MTNNNVYGAFIAGVGFTLALVALFQIGLNVGIKTAIDMLEEYPAARNFLRKNKKIANVLPYVIGGSND